jgi:putative methionine-R-sulfoxide reductase with GAF domain
VSYFGHPPQEGVPFSTSSPSAEDHSRLLRDYADATEQFRATNEVLIALGRSTSDPDAVLDTVVESARRLCRGHTAAIYLIESGTFRLASSVGLSQEFVRTVTDFPMEVNRGTVLGRAAVERRIQKVRDVLTDTEYARSDVQQKGGIRSTMSAPMLLDDEVVGGISVFRTEVDPFDDREEALLEVFAAQAAVVVHNVHLVRALEARGAELVRRVEQMEALSDVARWSAPAWYSTRCCPTSSRTRFASLAATAARSWSTSRKSGASYEGTLERFTGDGLMVFFNDPIPVDDPTQRAVEMALVMRDRVAGLVEGWSRLGHDLGFGVGIAQGFATLGRIGYEGRFDYAAIGTVTNLAARLCGEADAGQVLVSQRVFSAVEAVAAGEPVGALELKGFSRPIRAFGVSRMINSSAEVPL